MVCFLLCESCFSFSFKPHYRLLSSLPSKLQLHIGLISSKVTSSSPFKVTDQIVPFTQECTSSCSVHLAVSHPWKMSFMCHFPDRPLQPSHLKQWVSPIICSKASIISSIVSSFTYFHIFCQSPLLKKKFHEGIYEVWLTYYFFSSSYKY